MNNSKQDNRLNLFTITIDTIAVTKVVANNNIKSDLKKSCKQWLISFGISLLLSIFIAFSRDTVNIMNQTISLTNNISVAFIAMIIGSFSLYQALLSGSVLYELYKKDDLLKELNESWLGIIMLYLYHIIINIVLLIILQLIPTNYLLFKSHLMSCILACFLIFLYMSYTFRILIEIKNLVVNLYNVFQIYNRIKILDEIDKKDSEN